MGDVPIRPTPEPEPSAVETTVARVNAAITAVAPGVSTRRVALFVIVGWGLLFSGLWAGFAIVALIVLALTDQVVAL